ncbi:MAG: hypothetical protein J1F22_04635 [Lachnospiraceae bacterium]|nr:hypothetical protein [Lachnospiraceae bacterium]
MLVIRRANREDIPGIMEFIDLYWKKNHICAVSPEFFEWMYCDKGQVNFNIAVDEDTKEIWGINGFVCYNSEENPDVSGTLWKARKTEENIVLGIDLGNFLKSVTQYNHNFSVGVSTRAFRMEKLRGKKVAELKRYYMLNPKSEYQIARIRQIPQIAPDVVDSCFEGISDMTEFKDWINEKDLRENIPYKDYAYIGHRYFGHPVYRYQMLGLCVEGQRRKGIFVGRTVEQNGTCIFKIVDFFGRDKEIGSCHLAMDKWMRENDFEYIDFYEYGISDIYMEKAGFTLLEDDTNIIPNYFEPFVQSNVRIPIVLCEGDNLHIYRGDADQDRPSLLGKRRDI